MTSLRFAWHSLKTRITLTTLTLFAIGIWSLAFYTSRTLREDMENLLSERQFSTMFMHADGQWPEQELRGPLSMAIT